MNLSPSQDVVLKRQGSHNSVPCSSTRRSSSVSSCNSFHTSSRPKPTVFNLFNLFDFFNPDTAIGGSHTVKKKNSMYPSEDSCHSLDIQEDPKDTESLLTTNTTIQNPKKKNTFATALWLVMWFLHNSMITLLNKKALSPIRLPATLTMTHMIINSVAAYLYIHVFHKTTSSELPQKDQRLLFYFSFIFVSNIVIGNWSLGAVSVSVNQVMRAMVPGVTLVLSMLILGKEFTWVRKISLIPIAIGVYIACSGDNSYTIFGLLVTMLAVVFAGIKIVLSSKFLTGDLKLHPVDLILRQAPLSVLWCFISLILTGEGKVLVERVNELSPQFFWFFITGVLSFSMNITSFFANQMTSALTLAVLGNVKQVVVILLSIYINDDLLTAQKAFGILIVVTGGAIYTTISYKESQK